MNTKTVIVDVVEVADEHCESAVFPTAVFESCSDIEVIVPDVPTNELRVISVGNEIFPLHPLSMITPGVTVIVKSDVITWLTPILFVELIE